MLALSLIFGGTTISALHGTGAQPHAGQPGVSPHGLGKGNFPCSTVLKNRKEDMLLTNQSKSNPAARTPSSTGSHNSEGLDSVASEAGLPYQD